MNVESQAIGDPDSFRAYQLAPGQAGDQADKVDHRTGGVPGYEPGLAVQAGGVSVLGR